MPLIDQEALRALHRAIIDCGLASELESLLEGLPPGYVASLPTTGAPAARLLRVLGHLDRTQRLADGTVPLRVLIENASHLAAGREESSHFADILRRLGARPAPSGAGDSPLRLLFLSAQPESETTLNPGRAYRAIEEAIAQTGGKDRVRLASGWAVRPTDLLPHLEQHRPHLVHLHAHGSLEGMVLEWEDERSVIVRPEAIQALLRSAGEQIRLVFFGGCNSARVAESAVTAVDFAIGMRGPVEEKAETRFAATFYGSVSAGRSVRSAFEQGLAVLRLLGLEEQQTPILWARAGRDAATTRLVTSGDRNDVAET